MKTSMTLALESPLVQSSDAGVMGQAGPGRCVINIQSSYTRPPRLWAQSLAIRIPKPPVLGPAKPRSISIPSSLGPAKPHLFPIGPSLGPVKFRTASIQPTLGPVTVPSLTKATPLGPVKCLSLTKPSPLGPVNASTTFQMTSLGPVKYDASSKQSPLGPVKRAPLSKYPPLGPVIGCQISRQASLGPAQRPNNIQGYAHWAQPGTPFPPANLRRAHGQHALNIHLLSVMGPVKTPASPISSPLGP
jgi:hypothetical protein